MEYIPVTMVRPDLLGFPRIPLPKPFSLRLYREGDENDWARVESAVGEFAGEKAALRHFLNEFGPHLHEMERRCLLLEENGNGVIGTATAWYNESFLDEAYGRLHWVGILPQFQGRGLSKPLVSEALRRLRMFHRKAYLTSQTTSYVAIKVYLDFGFQPHIIGESCRRAWSLLAAKLKHPGLKCYLEGDL
jgi:GNAT superfamily N-acetyltransferase